MSTNSLSAKTIKRNWQLIDAKGMVLGRLAVQVAGVLRGKSKVNFVPYLDLGDYVVVTNAALVKVSGKKAAEKQYVRHSGYPGGKRVQTFNQILSTKPEKIIEHAVKGMLPKGSLGDQMYTKLHVFPGSEHPYTRQLAGEKVVKEEQVSEVSNVEEAKEENNTE